MAFARRLRRNYIFVFFILVFFLILVCIAYITPDEDTELAHGNVHV